MSESGLAQSRAAMTQRGASTAAIDTFERFYRMIESGEQGLIPEASIAPLGEVETLAGVVASESDRRAALAKVAVVKLNGGLGTSMGLSGPKTALKVRGELTFLDIIARQTLALRARYGVDLPLLLMNSFRTREESLEILAAYPELEVDGLPLDFLQNAEPKLTADTLEPVAWPADPELEWCPPGHGDVYVSLQGTGLLDALRAKGIRYVFLSNADNLGATCDPDIAAWLIANDIPYAAEVCERTANDRKGGHLAVRRSDGQLILRDSAMVAPGEDEYFQDNTLHTLFHANNLWVDLDVLARLLDERGGVLGLPVIVNRKTVDPTDAGSPKVVQIESAMGAAIEVFEGSRAISVPRNRFRPVKSTNELLLVQSDIFEMDEDAQLVATIDHAEPAIRLGSAYRFVPDFLARFPAGPPSLRECTALTVSADATFGAGVRCVGEVVVDRPGPIADGAVLTGKV
ncbi:MAG: UTP--glucose-1-phosphate uridylyltransferase [Actinobacteria bacterium]|uniref:UTP--glucose-1-phosphate uridylyltransferase n=1 Tax=Nostocoides veronense TaxID=330836 RepID=A0ABN2LPZ5_9MICO|nr:UTP--glucose-1-phosphate uridylyltransferase [Actinomycetota bacterium]